MKPLLIIYFSGVGNTKTVAENMKNFAKNKILSEIYSIENLPENFTLSNYSAVIIGTPTYHSEPAKPLIKFLETLKTDRKIPAFIFTTCGLYPENCLRILAQKCLKQKIITIHSASYRCSATDGILIAPFIDYRFENEKELHSKIAHDFTVFLLKLKLHSKADIPKSKWYAFLNYPNKMLGKSITFPIYLHREKCIKCGKCQKKCPMNAINTSNGYPVTNKAKCINCYRCIHHCPALALSLSGKRSVKKVWRKFI